MLLIFLLLIFCLFSLFVNAQPEGWRMIDRFYGIRYQLTSCDGLEKFAVALADELACFGWIQSPQSSQNVTAPVFVGEARCSKKQGPKFQSYLNSYCSKLTGHPADNIFMVLIHLHTFVYIISLITYCMYICRYMQILKYDYILHILKLSSLVETHAFLTHLINVLILIREGIKVHLNLQYPPQGQ